ncbi:hypothetical protein PQH03_07775 [Ralstonia insidiosa]|jgi:uncharacterized protein YdcH (DUF465 family)|uniref:YdcH family protein n=2 Tax=Pseudomonadota TaxID=1224 RepID=UPI000664C14C|nr:hypothetical protein [Ralstonia insidiosa]KMW47783.1 hypothetical protein AC240_05245 [Ralstonia sp. MD27]MBX3770661.1 hypothetical protein [Ralstonia pickettii]NOZ19432.1 hypothetical protein [Betaproteobacteria bacterium]MBA9854823.1 hypothetical protein [Ralstonia insidiosa]MBA9868638.1 hypothetical protein [Ralstonia insidiosa]
MFSDCHERIAKLKTQDPRFSRLLRRHTALEQHVRNMESAKATPAQPVLAMLKREKQVLEGELRAILQGMPVAEAA